jgi:signal transduction histidine kinase
VSSASLAAPSAGDSLANLALAASCDLGSDIIITTRRKDNSSVIAGFAGVSAPRAAQLLDSLSIVERRLSREPFVLHRLMHGQAEPESPELSRFGYQTLATARVRLGNRRIGAIHALSVSNTLVEPTLLLPAYASHVAVAIAAAQARPRDRQRRLAESTVEGLEELALSAMSFPDLLAGLNSALSASFGPISSGLALWDDRRQILYFVPGSFGADQRTAVSCQVATIDKHSNAARIFATGDPYLSNHAKGDPALMQNYVAAFGLERLIALRLELRGERIGVLYLANKSTGFRLSDISKLQDLAPQISVAVQLARGVFLLRRQQRLEGILSDAAVAIASGASMKEFLPLVLNELCVTLEASMVVVTPTDREAIIWQAGSVQPELERDLLAEAARQPRQSARLRRPTKAGDPGWAALHVPVRLGSDRVATLSTLRLRAEPFAPDERSALARIGKLAALATAMDSYQQQRAELARVAERQRIADDLHDDVAQILFGAQMALDSALESTDLSRDVARNVITARRLLTRSDDVLRGIIGQLTRDVPVDLASSLASLVANLEDEYSLPIRLTITERASAIAAGLDRGVRKTILRTARECLVNVAKHGGPACRATIALTIARERLVLSIADDGIGAQNGAEVAGYGLSSRRRLVRNLGGHMRVRASAGGGTVVTVSFPL